jgi:hypothetical protein
MIVLELVNLKPISTNHMYYTYPRKGGKGTFKTKSSDYLKFITKVHLALHKLVNDNPELRNMVEGVEFPTFPSLSIEVDIPLKDYQTKSGKLKSHDSSNFIKATEDALFSYFNENINSDVSDHMVIHVSSSKKPVELEVWTIRIYLCLPKVSDDRKEYKLVHKFE